MGLDDKIKNAAENAKGQGKEAAGKATERRAAPGRGPGGPVQGRPEECRREGQGRVQELSRTPRGPAPRSPKGPDHRSGPFVVVAARRLDRRASGYRRRRSVEVGRARPASTVGSCAMADRPRTRVSLVPDCASCFGLCCVALPFAASADFPVDKPAGQPCGNLRGDFRCGIHARLRETGWKGCTVFDCFGAGQQVSQVTFGGVSWRDAPGTAGRCTPCCRSCGSCTRCSPTWGRRSRSRRPPRGRGRAAALLEEVEELTAATAEALLRSTCVALRARVGPLLQRTSAAAARRAPGARAGTDVTAQARAPGADLLGRGPARRGPAGGRPAGRLPHRAPTCAAPTCGAADLLGADLRDADLATPTSPARSSSPSRSSTPPGGTRGRASRARCDGRTTGPDAAPATPRGGVRPTDVRVRGRWLDGAHDPLARPAAEGSSR